jgi:hypothetical protein
LAVKKGRRRRISQNQYGNCKQKPFHFATSDSLPQNSLFSRCRWRGDSFATQRMFENGSPGGSRQPLNFFGLRYLRCMRYKLTRSLPSPDGKPTAAIFRNRALP